MHRKSWREESAGREQQRVLARVLAEDLRRVHVQGGESLQIPCAVTAPPPGWDTSGDPENDL